MTVTHVSSGVTSTGNTVRSGNTLDVLRGGETIDTTVRAGGREIVSSGGVASGTTVDGGSEIVSSGGLASGTFVYNGGMETIVSGGVASGTTVGANGVETIAFGGVATNTQLDSDGTLTDNGRLVFTGGGSIVEESAINGSGSLRLRGGGTVVLTSADGYTGGTVLEAGTLELENQQAAGTGPITFAAGGKATLEITGTTMPGNTISGFAAGDSIDLASVAASSTGSVVLAAGNVLDITEGGQTYQLQLDPTQSFAGERFVQSGPLGTDITVEEVACFCRGTRILTPRGEVAVERLALGDMVTTLAGEAQKLTWIGRGRSLVTAANPGARPIVVRQGALADGVPARDLFLTKGHSLLLDGVLIPVEYLVNDRSIAWDITARVVEFYHLELARHDVLLAEGAAAESYREDGNRHLFHNTDLPRHADADMAHYAPVLTGGPEVDRVWQRLLARAGASEAELTEDADLHLLADGARVEGEADGMLHRFHLDRTPFALHIRSRVCNPVRLGNGRDPRDLGVALRRLVLRGSGVELVLHYDSPWLTEGYNGAEPAEAIRWTMGDGVVPERALATFEGPVEVELLLGSTTRYPRPAAEPDDAAPLLRSGAGV